MSCRMMFSLVLIVNVIWCSGSDINEDEVLALNKENFFTVINENNYVLIEFYAPTCGACIDFAPEYAKVAQTIKKTNDSIKIAKVNAIEETEIAKKHGIDGYPTIRFFRKGSTPLDYKGLRLAENLVSWVIKRTGPPAVHLNTLEEAKSLIENNKVVTIGFFSDESDEAVATYLSVAESSEDSVFAITFARSVLENFNARVGSIILFNKEYENEAVFNKEFTKQEIAKFVEIESLPLVMEFQTHNAAHVFGGYIKSHLLIFLSKGDLKTEHLLEDLKPIAKTFKGKVLFTFFDADNSEYDGFYDFWGIRKDSIPTVRIFHFGKQLEKYKPINSDLTNDNIRNFVQDYLDGKLEKHLRSEVLPKNWNAGPVYVLVGDNFESVVMDTTKDVLVKFHAPWCQICNKFAPIYELIAEHFKEREDIIIAKIDASKNEFKNKVIQSLPTIALYTKTNDIIDYTGNNTFEAIIKFVESGGTIHTANNGESLDQNDESNSASNTPIKQEL